MESLVTVIWKETIHSILKQQVQPVSYQGTIALFSPTPGTNPTTGRRRGIYELHVAWGVRSVAQWCSRRKSCSSTATFQCCSGRKSAAGSLRPISSPRYIYICMRPISIDDEDTNRFRVVFRSSTTDGDVAVVHGRRDGILWMTRGILNIICDDYKSSDDYTSSDDYDAGLGPTPHCADTLMDPRINRKIVSLTSLNDGALGCSFFIPLLRT